MTPERWQIIKNIVKEALEQPVHERAAFAALRCGEDTDLLTMVLSLLEGEDYTTTVYKEGSKPLRALFEKGDGSEYSGLELGPYSVERELGRGGMGVVLLARDTRTQRQVAVKILRQGLESQDAVVRFHYERLILSELDHPNIASLLDGGTTNEGHHYLVMEFISGLPIDEYCDRHRLDTRARLELFRKVVEAVAYAHNRKVVHRDIKPANILIGENGEPVLLDFGIAKMTDPTSLAHAPRTATGKWMMTPEYASPEQVKGIPPAPTCDIYALGVLLYELLTGQRPYQVLSLTPGELARAICEQEILKPSKIVLQNAMRRDKDGTKRPVTAVAMATLRGEHPETLRGRLRGDLDKLILTALSKEAEDRYPHASQMARDIDNFLAGRGVSATGTPLTRRASRWFSRNRVGIKTINALVLVLLGFAVARLLPGELNPVTQILLALEKVTEEPVTFMAIESPDPPGFEMEH